MKHTIQKALLLSAALILLINNASTVKASTSKTYMPHIDAFTIALENSIHMPQANPYHNMVVADVNDYVNVRTAPGTEAEIAGRIYNNGVAEIIKYSPVDDAWLEIESGNVKGYVKAEFFRMGEAAAEAIEAQIQKGKELTYARSMEEIRAEQKALDDERKQKAATLMSQRTESADTGATDDLRKEIVDFAMQYLGGPYVHGGNSLTNGTDCSGFTSLIFAEFGYSISRTPSGQLSSAGTKIEYSEIQPGDIICYTSNGTTCTHVALYIGNGEILHAANSRKGIIINNADYSTIMGVKRIIE